MYINHYREHLLDAVGLNLDIKSAKGNVITLRDGKKVKDFLSQYGALPFGHNPDFSIEALNLFINNESPIFIQPNIHKDAKRLAEKLANQINSEKYKHCVFTNSGAETVEVAIKLARLYTHRKKILSLANSFHGKTFNALSATGSNRFKADFIADNEAFEHVPYNDFAAIEEKLKTNQFAAFIMEPVQGEGGMITVAPEILENIIKLCKKTGTVSILDEIQTGLGRIGDFCAATLYQLSPDIILFSKALGAGVVPIGAMLYSERLHLIEFDKKHSSTFANNGLVANMGIAVIDYLTENNQEKIQYIKSISKKIDAHLSALANKYPKIFSWQGTGLMRGLEINDTDSQTNIILNYSQISGRLAYVVCSYLLQHYGIFTMPLMSRPCSIRFEPPLDVSEQDIDYFFEAFDHVCQVITNGRYDMLFAYFVDLPLASLPSINKTYPIHTNNQVAAIKIKKNNLKESKKFAFLIHSMSIKDFNYNYCQAIKENYTDSQKKQLAQWVIDTAVVDFSPDIGIEFSVETNNNFVNGMLIYSPLTAEQMMKLSLKERAKLLQEFLDIAKSNGASIVGLGAYTSVISSGGENLLDNKQGLLLTNGNSLTAMSVTECIRSMTSQNTSNQKLAIIGARGSVGRLIVIGLAHNFSNITLIGRPKTAPLILKDTVRSLLEIVNLTKDVITKGSLLDKMNHWVSKNAKHLSITEQQGKLINVISEFGLTVSEDYKESLSHADFVVSATSEGKAFIDSSLVKESAIILDAARPFDFIKNGNRNIYEGGLMHQPNSLCYGHANLIDTPAGVNLACLSETIAMALDDTDHHLSIGKNIDYNMALNILVMSKKYGFSSVLYKNDVIQDL